MQTAGEQSQMDLAYAIEKPDWVALKILTEEIQDELSQNRSNLLYCLSNWFLSVTIFKRFEERHMVMCEPGNRDIEYHRVTLTGVLATGEKLLHELSKHREVDTGHVGIEMAEVVATVEELRLCYSEWFGDTTQTRKAEIRREVFGAG